MSQCSTAWLKSTRNPVKNKKTTKRLPRDLPRPKEKTQKWEPLGDTSQSYEPKWAKKRRQPERRKQHLRIKHKRLAELVSQQLEKNIHFSIKKTQPEYAFRRNVLKKLRKSRVKKQNTLVSPPIPLQQRGQKDSKKRKEVGSKPLLPG